MFLFLQRSLSIGAGFQTRKLTPYRMSSREFFWIRLTLGYVAFYRMYHGAMGAMQGLTLQQIYDRIADVLWDTQKAQWVS